MSPTSYQAALPRNLETSIGPATVASSHEHTFGAQFRPWPAQPPRFWRDIHGRHGPSTLVLLSRPVRRFATLALQLGINKRLELTIKHLRHVAALMPVAMVFDAGVIHHV